MHCKRSARGCLILLIKAYLTKSNHKAVVDAVEPIARALTDYNVDMMSQLFSAINNAYRAKFKDGSAEHQYARSVMVLHKEERVLRQTQAAAIRVEHNIHAVQVSEVEVFAMIDRLLVTGGSPVNPPGEALERGADAWKDLLIGLALCSGARLIELCGVSKYSESKLFPGLLHVEGVAKDERAAAARGHARHLDKPLIGVEVSRFVDLVDKARGLVREVLSSRNVNLQEALRTNEGRQQISGILSPRLNPRVKQLFPELNPKLNEIEAGGKPPLPPRG